MNQILIYQECFYQCPSYWIVIIINSTGAYFRMNQNKKINLFFIHIYMPLCL